jgi:hypothetical protein
MLREFLPIRVSKRNQALKVELIGKHDEFFMSLPYYNAAVNDEIRNFNFSANNNMS